MSNDMHISLHHRNFYIPEKIGSPPWKSPLLHLLIPSSPSFLSPAGHWSFHCLYNFVFSKSPQVAIMHYVAFSDWFLLLSNMHLKPPFLFMAGWLILHVALNIIFTTWNCSICNMSGPVMSTEDTKVTRTQLLFLRISLPDIRRKVSKHKK